VVSIAVAVACCWLLVAGAVVGSNSSSANKLNGIQRWAKRGAGRKSKGLCTANSSLIVIANEWMHLLWGFVCQTTANLWVSISSSRSSLVAPRVVAPHFAVCSCSFCWFCCSIHCFPISKAMVLLLRKPAGGVYAVCCLPFRNCVFANELAANNISVLAIIWRPLHQYGWALWPEEIHAFVTPRHFHTFPRCGWAAVGWQKRIALALSLFISLMLLLLHWSVDKAAIKSSIASVYWPLCFFLNK